MPDLTTFVHELAIWAVPVILAITVHEVAHGYAARELGDDTAARAGRLSLNPLRHVDPVGTVIVPAVLLFLGGFLFGWAKPVPVVFGKLRQPRRDMAIVAAAGPAVNLVMAAGWALLFALLQSRAASSEVANGFATMALAGTSINLVLAVLNLLPVPPLDGGRIAVAVLPLAAARLLARVEPIGMFLLIALMASGMLSAVMSPIVDTLQALLFRSVGVTN